MKTNLTIPVFNEERRIANTATLLYQFLTENLRNDWELVVASNGSTDRTVALAKHLCAEYPKLSVIQMDQKGRGGALKQVWLNSDADVLSYMDADLSSDVHAFPRLIEPLLRGTYDVATGSRLLNPQTTERSAKRELLSRGYNRLLKVLLRTRFSDAQCGFKAITRRAAQQILPLIANSNWFFDTELLVLAERRGFRVFDLPIVWIEAPDSKVHLCRTIIEDLSGILRLKFNAENRALGALP